MKTNRLMTMTLLLLTMGFSAAKAQTANMQDRALWGSIAVPPSSGAINLGDYASDAEIWAAAEKADQAIRNNIPTGIDATLVNSEKVNSGIFDLQGRPVTSPKRGLYIKNGKKIVIR